MMVFRITRSDDPQYSLSGIGAAIYPGRWNREGFKVVYTSDSLAAATLEMILQFGDIRHLRQSYWYYRIELDDDHIYRVPADTLPSDWKKARPYSYRTQSIATRLFTSVTDLQAILLPSSIIPETQTVVINPEFLKPEGIEPQELRMDARFSKLIESND